MGMSRTSFFSRFKELAGISPQDYLTHYRIAYAKHLLTMGGQSISEVAYKSGFSDPKYFSRVFKKIEGVSPSSIAQSRNNTTKN
jgi:AraC-like DNA-binding protein